MAKRPARKPQLIQPRTRTDSPVNKTVTKTSGPKLIRPSTAEPTAPRQTSRSKQSVPVKRAPATPATEARQTPHPKAPTEKTGPIKKAKKLAIRQGNQTTQIKLRKLREKREDLKNIAPTRLQKILAQSGVGSRRDAEILIAEGKVTLNGHRATLGDKVSPGDKVTVKGKPVHLFWQDRLPRIIIYHKEEGEIVSRDDPKARTSVFDRLPQTRSSRWITIGRLDMNTSGLLIFTTDGELAQRFSHPRYEVERSYAVRIMGKLTEEQKKALLAGVILDDGPAKFDRLEDDNAEENDSLNHWYHVTIKEGRNREVRRIFESMGLTVSRLIRTGFGPIGLPPRLKRGQYYELNEQEVVNMLRWAKLDVPGVDSGKRRR